MLRAILKVTFGWGIALGVGAAACTYNEAGDAWGDAGDDGVGAPSSSRDGTEQCLGYCNRLSVCGAPQASDFDACLKACDVRFQKLPQATAELCACTIDSRCDDVVEGRCSEGTGGGGTGGAGGTGNGSSGGTAAHGGSGSHGGSTAAGGTTGGSGAGTGGVTPSGGGTAGTSSVPGEGGAPCNGSSGSSSGTGNASGGAAVNAGAGGEPGAEEGVACTCDCDCPSAQTCVSGRCAS